jgi:hypothetical protein
MLAIRPGCTAAQAPDIRVLIDFRARVTGVSSRFAGAAALYGKIGHGHIRYERNPVSTGFFAQCKSYYFDAPQRSFAFDLPAAGLRLRALPGRRDFNLEVCDGFNDVIDDDRRGIVDRIRFFGETADLQLSGYTIARMTIRFLDSSASVLTDMSAMNVLDPQWYDVQNFWIMIDIGEGITTAGLTLSFDSVEVREQVIADACTGDCNGDGEVTVDEIVLGVGIGLESEAVGACPASDVDRDAGVDVSEIIGAVSRALCGCEGAC